MWNCNYNNYYNSFLPGLSAGHLCKRVDDVGWHRLISGHAQIVDESVALETSARIPQNVTERVLLYELVTQPLDVLPVDRICRARCAVINVYVCWPIESQTRFVLLLTDRTANKYSKYELETWGGKKIEKQNKKRSSKKKCFWYYTI